jgi:hypothetical protein
MGKFISINYTRVVCQACGVDTIIEPGREFKELNCKCNTEVSKQFSKIEVYTDGNSLLELLGEFKNGDVEVKHEDGTLSYRMPKKTFETFTLKGNENATPTPNDTKESTLQLKAQYTVEELKEMAKEKGIKGYGNMREGTLIEKLFPKAE